MTQTITSSHEVSDYGIDHAILPGTYPRGEAEYQASADILRLIDKHGTVTRQLIAQQLARHGVCLLRDVLQAQEEMDLIETIAGGAIRRCSQRAATTGRLPRPARPAALSPFSACEHFH